MDAYEKKTGGSVLAIAHNGNLINAAVNTGVKGFVFTSSIAVFGAPFPAVWDQLVADHTPLDAARQLIADVSRLVWEYAVAPSSLGSR